MPAISGEIPGKEQRARRWWLAGTSTAAALVLLALAGTTLLVLRSRHAVEGWYAPRPTSPYFAAMDRVLLGQVTDTGRPAPDRYAKLFDYLLAGFLEFATPAGERVTYPGIRGKNGHSVEGLEGFARTAPLFAAWLASGRPPLRADPRDPSREVDLRLLLRRGVLAGTDPASPAYWGDIADYDQRIVEAADVALLLWLSRDHVWSGFSAAEREQVAGWLRQAQARAVWPNNWFLFTVVVAEALRALGAGGDDGASAAAYRRFKTFYLGSGWFEDPPKGVDYYNAWAISYALFWIDQMSPGLDRTFIRQALGQSASLVLHLIGPQGPPMMGRSLCYRMAVPAPVVMQAMLDPGSIDPGQARRAMDLVWLHYLPRDGLAQGRAEQGLYGPDPRLLDTYTGPGSCQWSLRSLVPAFLQAEASAFWQAPERPLPVEQGDYRLDLPALGWVVTGHRQSGEVTVGIPANAGRHHPLVADPWPYHVAEYLLGGIFRSDNDRAKYGNGLYSSAAPIGDRAQAGPAAAWLPGWIGSPAAAGAQGQR